MNFLGMGPMELMLILVLALIIFGPGKLPEVAGQVGKAVRDMRRATSDLSGEFNRTLSLELEEKREADASKAAATPVAVAATPPPAESVSLTPPAESVPVAPVAAVEPAAVEPAAIGPAAILAAPAGSAPAGLAQAEPALAEPVPVSSVPPVPALSDNVTPAPEVSAIPRIESTSEAVVSTGPATAAPTTPQVLTVSASDLADVPPAPSAVDLPSAGALSPTVLASTADARAVATTEPPLADTTDWHWEEPWSPEPAPAASVGGTNVLAAVTPPASATEGAPSSVPAPVQASGQAAGPVSPARPQDTPDADGTLAERGAGQSAGSESARPERPPPA